MMVFWTHFRLFFTFNKFSKSKLRLKLGVYYLKKGTIFQVGQPMDLPADQYQQTRRLYIKNLFYNYRDNKVTHTFSKKPIKGLSEKFAK